MVATAGPSSAARVRGYGARVVLDYHDPDWPARVRDASPGGGGDGMRKCGSAEVRKYESGTAVMGRVGGGMRGVATAVPHSRTLALSHFRTAVR